MTFAAVVSITVALLGGPQGLGPFTAEGPYAGRLAAPLGYGLPLQGEKIMYDAAAGLTTILGPDEAAIRGLFEENGGSKAAVIEPIIEGGLYTWPESQFEFLWPEDRPQYYLEKLPGLYRGYTVYGRIELVDKEGYTVSVRPTGGPDELTVQVEFANKILSGGKYDETIRAFVGRPTLIKAIVTATAPLTIGQKTLLVWQPRPDMHVLARAARAAPAWAIGEWEMTGPGDDTGVLTVKADGTAIWHLDNGGMMAEPGSVDSSGQVHVRLSLTGEHWTILSGELAPDGTASGRISPQSMTWTAIRVQAPGIERAAPVWAVGEWEMKVPGEDARPALIVVQPNGDVLIEDHPWAITGDPKPSGTLSLWGQLQYRVFQGGRLFVRMAGKINPDGTGSGSGYAERPGIGKSNCFTWTATKVRCADPAALKEQYRKLLEELVRDSRLPVSALGLPAQSAPTLRVLDREPHPTGVAVLLEVTVPQQD